MRVTNGFVRKPNTLRLWFDCSNACACIRANLPNVLVAIRSFGGQANVLVGLGRLVSWTLDLLVCLTADRLGG